MVIMSFYDYRKPDEGLRTIFKFIIITFIITLMIIFL